MIGMGVSEIMRLSQEEGFNDREIAMLFGVHRTTITRVRLANNIPKCNVLMKKDKLTTCRRCGKGFIIRRGQIRPFCYECEPIDSDGEDRFIKESAKCKRKQAEQNKI